MRFVGVCTLLPSATFGTSCVCLSRLSSHCTTVTVDNNVAMTLVSFCCNVGLEYHCCMLFVWFSFWRHRMWCGVKTFGVLIYTKKWIFLILKLQGLQGNIGVREEWRKLESSNVEFKVCLTSPHPNSPPLLLPIFILSSSLRFLRYAVEVQQVNSFTSSRSATLSEWSWPQRGVHEFRHCSGQEAACPLIGWAGSFQFASDLNAPHSISHIRLLNGRRAHVSRA
jgi:hypothetical protein